MIEAFDFPINDEPIFMSVEMYEDLKKPKLIAFIGNDGNDMLGVTLNGEIVWGTWEYSFFPNFEHFAVAPPQVCFDLSNYRGPRYIRVHVSGVYADDIIDTSREKEPRKQQS